MTLMGLAIDAILITGVNPSLAVLRIILRMPKILLSIILELGLTHPATHALRNGMAPPPPLWCSIALRESHHHGYAAM
jgi:hypothetical protein